MVQIHHCQYYLPSREESMTYQGRDIFMLRYIILERSIFLWLLSSDLNRAVIMAFSPERMPLGVNI